MKCMVSWFERPQGSALEYENAQKRILGVFRHWEMPSSLKVQLFVVRVGEWGGPMLVETSPTAGRAGPPGRDPPAVLDFPRLRVPCSSRARRAGRGERGAGGDRLA